jgi:hypothetical protein
MTVKYFKKKSDPQLIFLPNVTSTVIFGLDCDVEYQVQVRACMHVNESCGPYSDAQVISIQCKLISGGGGQRIFLASAPG